MNISSRALSSKRSLLATAILLFIILLPEAAVSGSSNSGGSAEVTCPGIPGKLVVLKNQPYALCAGAESVIFDEITYATCAKLTGNSISVPHQFPFPPVDDNPGGNIATVNEGAPQSGYIVSTYSNPAGLTKPAGNVAIYECDGGSYAQCDGGLCFTSTTGKTSPLWGDVSDSQIVCSCPVETSSFKFEVYGPNPCPTTAAAFDSVCGSNVSKANAGAIIHIGGPGAGLGQSLATCVAGHPVTVNTCTRPAR